MKKITAIIVVLVIASVLVAADKERASAVAEKTVELAPDVTLTLVYVPAGQFEMGSPADELKRDKDEGQHKIKITKPFYMGKFEVTQLQYRVLMSENNSKFGGDDLPVENVNWYQACRFLKKLSTKTGLKFRLPTEAEWEYACRAGTTTAFNTGTTIDADFANYKAKAVYADGIVGEYLDRTTPVGSYAPNAFGLYDMHGNVWEWCSDIYAKDYYKITPLQDPKGAGGKGDRVIRGGAWNEKPHKCRSADRNKRREKANQPHIGFRVVMEIGK